MVDSNVGTNTLGGTTSSDTTTPNVINTTNNTNGYKVKYQNFTFTLPYDYIYEQDSSDLIIGTRDETWSAHISVLPGSFE